MKKPGTFLTVAAFAVAGLAARAAFGQGYDPFLEVSKTEAGFTVEAEGATLPQVLGAIGAEAGFTVQDTGAGAPRDPIPTFQVRDATLESTLRQLLGTSNHLIVYRGAAGKIRDGNVERIVLLSSGKRERVADRPISSLAGPPGTEAPPRTARARTSSGPVAPDDGDVAPDDASPDATGQDFEQQEEEQLARGEALQEMEYDAIEQMDVDPASVAGGAPGVPPPGLPPDVLQRLEDYAEGNGMMPPPEMIAPTE